MEKCPSCRTWLVRCGRIRRGVIIMEKCPSCRTWLVSCPCCDAAFCPDCKMTEYDIEQELEDEEE